MKKVAKLIIENNGEYLIMFRSNHPTFGKDPDLPGGTAEGNESGISTMLREVEEEIGLRIGSTQAKEVFSGTDYSRNGTHYYLFISRLPQKPTIVMSWEHSSYEWVIKEEFINRAKQAKDTYMHMAADILDSLTATKAS